jgi:hypothetical protein
MANNKFDRMDQMQGVSANYKDYTINILVDGSEVDKPAVQTMLIICVNLLSGWCRSVNVGVDNVNCVLPNFPGVSLHVLLQQIGRMNNSCHFTLNQNSRAFNSCLVIGKAVHDGLSIWIDSDGWISGCGLVIQKLIFKKPVKTKIF